MMARLRLEQHGIPVFIENDLSPIMPWVGARLVIPADQVADTEALLAKPAGDE